MDLREWLGHPGIVTPRELTAAALRRGWAVKRQTGDHVILAKPGFASRLIIPLSTRANPTKKHFIQTMLEAGDDDDGG